MRTSWPFRIAATAMFAGTAAVDLFAKLGPLGDWSGVFDVAVNLLLVSGGIRAIVLGERRDEVNRMTEPDNDY